jgi:hypothetical protein
MFLLKFTPDGVEHFVAIKDFMLTTITRELVTSFVNLENMACASSIGERPRDPSVSNV